MFLAPLGVPSTTACIARLACLLYLSRMESTSPHPIAGRVQWDNGYGGPVREPLAYFLVLCELGYDTVESNGYELEPQLEIIPSTSMPLRLALSVAAGARVTEIVVIEGYGCVNGTPSP
ncbi:hypothetical protein C8R46DRAFT_1032886 [Mycena filopes]|nr:hypothetical protein C8R46DRAFT_1032886 [Mycena filopes]